MAESEDVAEGASGGAPAGGATLGATLAAARLRGRRQKDPELDDFLREQTRLARLQSEHLHEQRTLTLSRLRWGRFSDRMKALLQLMTALIGVGVVAVIGAMVWQAHEAHGLVIEAFSAPPDLAHTGLTGQVAASRFLDKLQALQTATANSDRPAESYESNWGSDFKVEIPETGLTFSEFDKLIRERVGHVSHVTGEITTTPAGIAVTARTGDAPPETFTGPPGSYDDLAQKAAEAVYRETQPYRFVEYLDNQGRVDEALKVVSDLAENGPTSERGWAYSRWALIELNDLGDAAAARRLAARGLGYGAGSDLNDRITMVNTAVWSGDEEADLALSRVLDRATQKRLPDTSENFYIENKLLARAWLNFIRPDYEASGADWMHTFGAYLDIHFGALSPAMAASAYARGHDLPAARLAMRQARGGADSTLVWDVAQGAFLALPGYWMPAETGRWPEALADARAVDAALEAGKAKRPVYGLMQQVWIWPLEALAQARTGDVVGAQALVGRTAPDCYPCLRARGQIAAQQQDWPAAERWFAAAVRQAPSLPLAYEEWGRMRLARGDPAGAIALVATAHAKGPRFADPLEAWGEALMAQGDAVGAARKFAEAAKLAPYWGRNHLKWGEALARSNRKDAARDQLRIAAGLDLTVEDRAELARSAL